MKATLFRLAALLLSFCASTQSQEAISWSNPAGGSFENADNWSQAHAPGNADSAIFDLPVSFVVDFPSNVTNYSARFNSGSPTVALSGKSWSIGNDVLIGSESGKLARPFFLSGHLIVTNPAGTAKVIVGGAGKGELGIRGASVTADFLQADARTNSFLNFDYGELTTLRGSRIHYPGAVTLGTNANLPMTWNIKGGTNEILYGGNSTLFKYGSLTLGTNFISPRVLGTGNLNVSGPATSLFVRDLDIYGNSRITLTDGAKLNTTIVQWGLQSKSSNIVVVVSDPQTRWTNVSFLHIGMHVEGQTLIITNGGFVQSGFSEYPPSEFQAMRQSPFSPPSNIIITGPGSEFRILGSVWLGLNYSSIKKPQSNVLLITNGGRFSAESVVYGSLGDLGGLGPTIPGNLIDVADGSLKFESLDLSVGALRVGQGTAIIKDFEMRGGPTNSILEGRRLLVAYHGELLPGDFQISLGDADINEFNGKVIFDEVIFGAGVDDNAMARMTNGEVNVTSNLFVGSLGGAVFLVETGKVAAAKTQIDAAIGNFGWLQLLGPESSLTTGELKIGPRGKLTLADEATLEVSGTTLIDGEIEIANTTLAFSAPVTLGPTAHFSGTNSSISFAGGVSLPANDIIVPPGITVHAASIQTAGGQLLDAASAFRITSRRNPDGSIEFSFPALGYQNFRFRVSENLSTWTDIFPENFQTDLSGTVKWKTPPSGSARFFQVVAD